MIPTARRASPLFKRSDSIRTGTCHDAACSLSKITSPIWRGPDDGRLLCGLDRGGPFTARHVAPDTDCDPGRGSAGQQTGSVTITSYVPVPFWARGLHATMPSCRLREGKFRTTVWRARHVVSGAGHHSPSDPTGTTLRPASPLDRGSQHPPRVCLASSLRLPIGPIEIVWGARLAAPGRVPLVGAVCVSRLALS